MASASASPSASPSASASNSPSDSPSASFSNSPSASPSKSPSDSPSASPSPVAASEVTYTINGNVYRLGKLKVASVKIQFGDGSYDRYTTGGIPLTSGKMGMGTVIALIILESAGDVYLYEWDRSANTIRVFSEARVELDANDTVLAATTLECLVIGK